VARTGDPKKSAVRFIVLLGTVSLFADITYEGARSINGPYLGLLGASAVVVGAVAGAGEFIGHALRLVSGLLSDRTRRYWVLLITGYTVNLLAVPALALAGRWEMAAGLMILERVGKAIRAPARDVLLSGAARRIGTGWGFGLHEALDQIGALTGPLVLAAVLGYGGGYRMCYAVLLVPAFMALSVLTAAKLSYGQPGNGFETVSQKTSARNLPRAFWLYLAASGLMAAGFADFPLIAFHLGKAGIVKEATVPLFYALAMGVDALAALAFGRFFDRHGIPSLVAAAIVSAAATPFLFLGTGGAVVLGVVFWGVGLGAQESVMRAAVAEMVPTERRGSAYGIFGTAFGLCWFLGSAAMGLLYTSSPRLLVVFAVVAQLAAIPFLLGSRKPPATSKT